MRISAALVLVVALGPAAHAETDDLGLDAAAQTITYVELYQVATRTAPAFEHAAFEFASADALVQQAEGPRNVVIRATGDFNRRVGAPTPPSTVGTSTTTITGQFGIAKLLPTNGTVELLTEAYRNDSDFSGNQQNNIQASVKLRITQPLLRNGWFEAHDRDRDSAVLVRDAGSAKLRGAALTLAADLAEKYWRLALLWHVRDIRRASIALGEKQKKQTEASIRNGKLAESELVPVQAAIAARKQALLNTELLIVDASLELRAAAGLEVTPTEVIMRTEPLPAAIVKGDTPDLETVVSLALKNNGEVEGARLVARSADLGARVVQRATLPKLDLRLEGGPLGNDTSSGVESSSLRTAVAGLAGFEGYSVSANLAFELPVGNDAARATVLEARATQAGARHELVDIQNKITSDVVRTAYKVRALTQSAELGATAVKLAEQNVASEQRKYELGRTTANEIIRLQDALEEAKLANAQSIHDHVVASAQLDAYTGLVLDKLGVTIKTTGYDLAPYIDGTGHTHRAAPGPAHEH